MKRWVHVAALAILAGCISTPSAPAPQSVASAFAERFPEDQTLAATLSTAPLAEETLTTGQISVVIRGHLGKVQTRDGGWIVQVPATGAEIVSYSTTEGNVGAALNVRGDNNDSIHNLQLTLPQAVTPADALVVASTYDSGQGRNSYWSVPGRSAVDEMMPVVFVRYRTRPGLIRPPAGS